VKIEGPLLNATFISRPNRFITIIKIDEKLYKSHLADPGRLKELLIPGADLLVRPVVKSSTNRKTKFSTIMINYKGQLISLVSTLPNKFVQESINKNQLPMFKKYKIIVSEFIIGRHRIDFLLNNLRNEDFLLEVKSVTFVKNGIAKFPDAITNRGKKHVNLLSDLVRRGKKAGVLFVCQRSDAISFGLMWDRDPQFSKALLDGYKIGLKIWCISVNLSVNAMSFKKELPVHLDRDFI
tara:strand:+ start:232 stop:945 length:714 start_codon:yes stop_codon:yes gene_type:complete